MFARPSGDALCKVVFKIQFGLEGNAAPFLQTGWSQPEEGFTWSLGKRSEIILPRLDCNNDYLIILVGKPYIFPPRLVTQHIAVEIGHKQIGGFDASDAFIKWFKIPRDAIGAQATSLDFNFPGAASPSAYGLDDSRLLSVAFRYIFLAKLHHLAQRAPHPKLVKKRGRDRKSKLEDWAPDLHDLLRTLEALIAQNRLSQARDYLENYAESAVSGINSDHALATRLVAVCMLTEQSGALMATCRQMFRGRSILIEFSASASPDPSILRCAFASNGCCQLTFRKGLATLSGPDSIVITIIASNFVTLLPLLHRYALSSRPRGEVILNLGDEAHVRGLAFCGTTPDTTLIPDPIFLRTDAYRTTREHFAANDVPWNERRNVALWRGSSTGYGSGKGVSNLERVRLCLHAKLVENKEIMDIGLSQFVQVSTIEAALLESFDIRRQHVPVERFQEWKYHIDIDGNSNSWPGLFQKLLSGSAVLKVASSGQWRQWYYGRLKPYENYVPVENDLSDLSAKIRYLIYNDELARKIGEAGRQLALSMTKDSEIALSMALIEQGIVYDALPSQGVFS